MHIGLLPYIISPCSSHVFIFTTRFASLYRAICYHQCLTSMHIVITSALHNCIALSQSLSRFLLPFAAHAPQTSIYCLLPLPPVILYAYPTYWGTLWRSWLRHCATSRKVTSSIPNGVIRIFLLHNPSGRTTTLGLTQLLTEMSTRNFLWG